MDRSIIELARERAGIAGNTPCRLAAVERQSCPTFGAERNRTQPSAVHPRSRLQRYLATDGESNLYWACGLLFAMGVLLALSGTHVGPSHGAAKGGVCHGQL
jgi:hypothetical protein